MKELSIFIDESGDFGEYERHSPFYIVTMLFHDQSHSISDQTVRLDRELSLMGLSGLCIHTGPIIRREEVYTNMEISDRRRILNKMVAFFRSVDIRYKCFIVEKRHVSDIVQMSSQLSKSISGFIRNHFDEFMVYDNVKLYYDNGQIELSKILATVVSAFLPNAVFKRVMPENYKLFQVADLICTMELIRHKLEIGIFSKSEEQFFGNERDLKRNYIRHIEKKEWR